MLQNTKSRILLVEDDADARETLTEWLEREGYEPVPASSGEQALQRIHDGIEVILTDLKMPGTGGMEILRAARDQAPHATVILMSGHGTVDTAVQALKEGAFDFLSKPINLRELSHRIKMALEKRALTAEIADLHRQLRQRQSVDNMVGRSPAIRQLLEKVRLVADTTATVLIIGESGTGKELVAKALHQHSSRKARPFLPVNCAAIPETLIESELFGHEKGAFTGAVEQRKGLFQAADGGTLFIDEIGEMPLGLQSKLLRAIENKRLIPVGSSKEIAIDVRLVAATNRDLAAAVEEKKFREDLYYRLNVVSLRLPPLRERADDIPLLVRYFLDELSREAGRDAVGITPAAMQALQRYGWPGNVRELRNTLEGIVVLSLKDQIDESDLPDHITGQRQPQDATLFQAGMTLQELECEAIRRTMATTGGHRAETARRLGLSVRTLQRKIKQYGLTVPARRAGRIPPN